MIEWLKDFFYYTPTERRGYIVMLSIIVIGRGLPMLYPYFYKPFEQDKIDLVRAAKDAAQYKAMFKKTDNTGAESDRADDDEKEFHAYRPFPFNPNTATREDFIRLGLMDKTANTIVHYREKGGKFYKPEDFKRIWGLANADYMRLKDYMNFETVAYRKKKDGR
jgi:competence protein ComEA